MDIDKLEKVLQGMTQERNVKPIMRKIAHWTKTVRMNGTYVTVDPREMNNIEKMRALEIFDISTDRGVMKLSLSESGKQLSDDFYRKAYYL